MTDKNELSPQEIISKRIKTARTNKGLKQEQLAEAVDISAKYVSKLENNTQVGRVSLQTLEKIAEVLEQPLIYFFIDSTKANTILHEELYQKIESLPYSLRKLVKEILSPITDFLLETFKENNNEEQEEEENEFHNE